jgi:hypothetical protein
MVNRFMLLDPKQTFSLKVPKTYIIQLRLSLQAMSATMKGRIIRLMLEVFTLASRQEWLAAFDLTPACAKDLTGSGSRQDRKFQANGMALSWPRVSLALGGGTALRCPRQRNGFSPEQWARALAKSQTRSQRHVGGLRSPAASATWA